MDISNTRDAGDAADQAARSKPVKLLGRAGLVAYGAVHLLVAYLAITVAIGDSGSGRKTDKGGALQTLSQNPGGQVLLWAIVAGLAALVVWQLAEAIWGQHDARSPLRRWLSRAVHIGEAGVFAALGFLAGKIAAGGGSGGGAQTLTARVLALPFGPLLLGIVGAGVIVVMAVVAYRGFKAKFTDDMDFTGVSPAARKTAIRLGQIGYIALAVAYGIVGVLIIVAAVQHDPAQPIGLDPALEALAGQPFGQVLLFVVAAGLACFGLYCLFDARYRRG
jgi:Domain of Unknown Function (DUF1206)